MYIYQKISRLNISLAYLIHSDCQYIRVYNHIRIHSLCQNTQIRVSMDCLRKRLTLQIGQYHTHHGKFVYRCVRNQSIDIVAVSYSILVKSKVWLDDLYTFPSDKAYCIIINITQYNNMSNYFQK